MWLADLFANPRICAVVISLLKIICYPLALFVFALALVIPYFAGAACLAAGIALYRAYKKGSSVFNPKANFFDLSFSLSTIVVGAPFSLFAYYFFMHSGKPETGVVMSNILSMFTSFMLTLLISSIVYTLNSGKKTLGTERLILLLLILVACVYCCLKIPFGIVVTSITLALALVGFSLYTRFLLAYALTSIVVLLGLRWGTHIVPPTPGEENLIVGFFSAIVYCVIYTIVICFNQLYQESLKNCKLKVQPISPGSQEHL